MRVFGSLALLLDLFWNTVRGKRESGVRPGVPQKCVIEITSVTGKFGKNQSCTAFHL